MAIVSKSTNRLLWTILGGLLIAVCAMVVIKAWPRLFPVAAVHVVADSTCDLRTGPCVTTIAPAGRISFSIEPREIPIMKPLRLRVEVTDIDSRSVEVDFSGVDMNMGFNRVALERVGAGGYVGKAMLPVCIRDTMEWEAKVMVDTPQGLISVAYRFVTARPGMGGVNEPK